MADHSISKIPYKLKLTRNQALALRHLIVCGREMAIQLEKMPKHSKLVKKWHIALTEFIVN